MPVARYPYNIFYPMLRDRQAVRILRIRHGARRSKPFSKGEFEG
jgi:plasmid stabilization system protein ParE